MILLISGIILGGSYIIRNGLFSNRVTKVDEAIEYFEKKFGITIEEKDVHEIGVDYSFYGENDDYVIKISRMDNSNSKEVINAVSGNKKAVITGMKDDPSLLGKVKIIDKNDDINNLIDISKPFFNNYIISKKQIGKWFDLTKKYGHLYFKGGNGAISLNSEKNNTYFNYSASSHTNSKVEKVKNITVTDDDSIIIKKDGKKVKFDVPSKINGNGVGALEFDGTSGIVTIYADKVYYRVRMVKTTARRCVLTEIDIELIYHKN